MVQKLPSLKELLVIITRPIAFVVALSFVFYFIFSLSWLLFDWIARPGVAKIPIWIIMIYESHPVIIRSFWAAVVLRSLSILQSGWKTAQGTIIPPYDPDPKPEKTSIRTWEASKKPIAAKRKNTLWLFVVSVLTFTASSYVYYFHVQWQYSEFIINYLQGVQSNSIINLFITVLSVPTEYGSPFIGGRHTIVTNIFLVWIPIFPFTAFFLNLNSYTYDIIREHLFQFSTKALFWSKRI